MSEFREDFLTGYQVIISEKRDRRPKDFDLDILPVEKVEHKLDCPFCTGNEEMVPQIVFSRESKLRTRVVENKYPIIETVGNVYGRHFVIIEGEHHSKRLFGLEEDEIYDMLETYINCAYLMYEDPRIKYVQLFKNYKKEGGASLEHPHSQVMGMAIVPIAISSEMINSKAYFESKGSCYFCDLIINESSQGARVVTKDNGYLSICPYASRYPYEVHILPQKHLSSILSLGEEDKRKLSVEIKKVLKKYFLLLGDIPLNMYFHFVKELNNYYHFHVEICPRLNFYAGLELSTGLISNTVMPERAARMLREI